MPATTIRVSKKIHDQVRALAQQTGESMQEVISKAIEQHQEQLFWRQVRSPRAVPGTMGERYATDNRAGRAPTEDAGWAE